MNTVCSILKKKKNVREGVTGELLRTYEEQLLHGMMFDYYCD